MTSLSSISPAVVSSISIGEEVSNPLAEAVSGMGAMFDEMAVEEDDDEEEEGMERSVEVDAVCGGDGEDEIPVCPEVSDSWSEGLDAEDDDDDDGEAIGVASSVDGGAEVVLGMSGTRRLRHILS